MRSSILTGLSGVKRSLKSYISCPPTDKQRTPLDRQVEGKPADLPAHLTHFPPSLPNPDIRRFSRQLILPEIGVSGQLALKTSSVLIVGAGGLGCPAGDWLLPISSMHMRE